MRPTAERSASAAARLGPLLHSLLAVAVARIALTVSSYAALQRLMPSSEGAAPEAVLRAVSQRVSRVARWVPYATCLTQAFAAQYLLARQGYGSIIRVGVMRQAGRFQAHAWLVSDRYVVVGAKGHDLSQYAVLTELKAPAR